ANAQAVVMTIHPELLPLVPLSTTLATTPPPKRIIAPVPMISATNGVIGYDLRFLIYKLFSLHSPFSIVHSIICPKLCCIGRSLPFFQLIADILVFDG